MPDIWLFFAACGHPFGLLDADSRSQTERQAWNQFYDTEKERRAAEGRGVTCRGVNRATYKAEYLKWMLSGCTCGTAGA